MGDSPLADGPETPADTVLTIDLDAIGANYGILQRQAAGARVAAVVKADAYGLGAVRVARVLVRHGCQTFFVARTEEGLALRRALPGVRIAILNGLTVPALYRDNRLLPVLNDPEAVRIWHEAGGGPAMLHADTGINRLGMAPDALTGLPVDRLAGVTHLISHLACADRPDDPMNSRQLARFTALRDWLAAARPGVGYSLANSAGIFLGPAYCFDLVRPGAALYGLTPTARAANPMRPVVSLAARLLQVREIDAPARVGYGATHRIARKARIATIAAGYADGVNRMSGNSGFAVLDGVTVPVVGRVSMDMMTLDVTGLDPHRLRPGMYAEVTGPRISVDQAAAAAHTIGHEWLIGLGRRGRRVYRGG